MADDLHGILDVLGKRVTRRTVLRGSALGAAGLATAALIGCGDDDDDDTVATAPAAAPVTTTTDDDDDAAAATPEIEYPNGKGKHVDAVGLPYAYNFPEPAIAPKSGGIMKVATSWDYASLDPTVSAAGGTVTVPNMVYNRLLGIVRGPAADPFRLELEPELAQSWERSPDGLTFTFHITPGIKWQNVAPLNGRAFVAEDARFALERYATEGVHKTYYVNVDSFEAVDDLTLKITMAKPTADFLNPLGSNKQTVFPHELVDDGTIAERSIGTGPMILKETTQSVRVTFDKNPDFFEREVLLDGFEFRIMPDHASRLAAFRVGQVDYAYQLVVKLTDVKNLVGTNPDVQINHLLLLYCTPLAFNLQNPKWEDVRVRGAVSLAIDRAAITEIVYEGLASTMNVIPWSYVFDSEPTVESGNLGPWGAFDPAEAMKLLAAAGHEDGLDINSIYYAYGAAQDQTSEVLVDRFRESGITLNSESVDYTEFNSQWVGGTLKEASTIGWGVSGFDPDNWFYGQVHSTSTGNRWQSNDPQIDAWAEEQQLELNPEARKELWRKIWDRDLAEAYRPMMPAAQGFEIYQPWVRGIRWGASSPNDNSSYYDWGDLAGGAWLDK